MLFRISKLKNRIRFQSPLKVDVVIWDEVGSEIIQSTLLKDINHFVIKSRPLQFYFGAGMVFFFCKKILATILIDSINYKKIKLGEIYLLALFEYINPKIVISFIDNSSAYHWLAKNYQGCKFFAIQNGIRNRYQLTDNKIYYFDHYFGFGNYEKDLFKEFGFTTKFFHPVGSLLGGYYKYNNPSDPQIKWDICIISAWRGNIGNTTDVQMTMKSMRKLDSFLSKYIKEQKIQAVIVLRSEVNSADRKIPVYGDEKDYYSSIYGMEVDLVDPIFSERNIYKIMDECNLVVTAGSTAAIEAFGWGKKTLYCDFTGTNLFNDYESLLLFTNDDYDLFAKHLNRIRNESHKQYILRTKSYASYLMNFNIENPAHLSISKMINKYC